jgi:thiol-disulfide isomerase/thioredoxin
MRIIRYHWLYRYGMRKKTASWLGWLGIAALLCLPLPVTASEARPASEKAAKMTDAHSVITRQQGWLNTSRPLNAADLKGRIVLLDFWTYCCINCMHILPDLAFLEQKFGPDLAVIGVHSAKFENERDLENIRQAILRYDIRHPVVNDFDFSTWNAFSVKAWPTFVLLDPNGEIDSVYAGEGHRSDLERDIIRLRLKWVGRLNTSDLPMDLERNKLPPTLLNYPGKFTYTEDYKGAPAFFVSDSGHHRILVIGLDGEILDSIGSRSAGDNDGPFHEASFNHPQGVLYKAPILYIADTNNHLLRAANFSTREVTTLAGSGKQGHNRKPNNLPGLAVDLASPWDLEFYPDENHIAIAMAGMHQLWGYDIKKKTLEVLAGNGKESIDDGRLPQNSLSQPSGLSAIDGKLYFVDAETSSLRVLEKGGVKTLVGSGLFDFGLADGKRDKARMQHPLGLFADGDSIYIADSYNHAIRAYDPARKELKTVIGKGQRGNQDGKPENVMFSEPNDVIRVKDTLYVLDTNNHALRKVDLATLTVTRVNVRENMQLDKAQFSETLPNVKKMDEMAVMPNANIELNVQFKEGWHINKDAPSYLAVFDMSQPQAPKPLAHFNRARIQQQLLVIPPLSGRAYRLQGTLYYCETKPGAQCLIKSFDIPLAPRQGSMESQVKIEVN